jgi:uncharacterized protein (TIGR03083 family)
MPDPLGALRSSSQHLRQIVHGLDAQQLDSPAYPAEWSLADVLSHIGSGAVIHKRRLEDILKGAEFPSDFSQRVWDEWNGKPSTSKRADALIADQDLVERLESLSNEEQSSFRFVMGPISEDFDGFVGLRLNEHVLHTWDIEVTLFPVATLNPEAVESVIDRLELITRFTGKAADVEPPLVVHSTDPQRGFTLILGPESVSLTPAQPSSDPDLVLPAEAFIRLIYGRLDAEHTPPCQGISHLDALRRVFPGP